jgi:hypothetical protein
MAGVNSKNVKYIANAIADSVKSTSKWKKIIFIIVIVILLKKKNLKTKNNLKIISCFYLHTYFSLRFSSYLKYQELSNLTCDKIFNPHKRT